jgi:hypothetical protein
MLESRSNLISNERHSSGLPILRDGCINPSGFPL